MRLLPLAALLASLALSPIAQAAGDTRTPSVFITLGTMGGPIASPVRSQPANVLLHGDVAYLVDVGDGTAGQLAKAGVKLTALKAVFISHLHLDHTGGLAAILGLRNQTNAPGVVTIYGPPGTKAVVDGIIASLQVPARTGYGIPGQSWAAPDSKVAVVELTDGSRVDIDGMAVTSVQNSHYEFTPGSAEDQQYKSLSLRFDLPDRSITYTGDTGPSAAVERLAQGSDLLVAEMMDLEATLAVVRRANPNMPTDAARHMVQHLSLHHLSSAQVGEMAARAGVKRVVVTHLAIGASGPDRIDAYTRDIKSRFPGTVALANDLDRH